VNGRRRIWILSLWICCFLRFGSIPRRLVFTELEGEFASGLRTFNVEYIVIVTRRTRMEILMTDLRSFLGDE
jgi:hypothetical protein